MMTLLVGLSFAGLLFCAAARGALAEFSRSKLEEYCKARNIDVLGDILTHDDDATVALRGWMRILLLGLTASFYGARGAGPGWSWVEELVLLWLGLLAAETWLARPIGEAFAEPFLYWSWSILNAMRLAFLPVLWLANAAGRLLHWLRGQPKEEAVNAIQEEILAVVNEGEREGAILGAAVEMIHGLMELHEVHVSQIMTPRTDIVMFPISMTVEQARTEVVESGHSRIPVFQSSRDDIVGILYAKDLLPHLSQAARADADLSTLSLRKPLYVPLDKPVDVLLRDFQRERVHLAIVVDEYHGVAGIVTIEDVIEEIVGEIQDEYDEDEVPPIRLLSDGVAEVDAWLDVDAVNEKVGLAIPEGVDYDTVGGFVSTTLGRIPKTGETFIEHSVKFTVLDATDRAIQRLRLEKVDELSGTSPSAGTDS